MLPYTLHKIGEHPQNLLIFLHGYNDSMADYSDKIAWFSAKLQSAYLIFPQSAQPCDKNPQHLQWFGMLKYDPDNKRRQAQTSTAEIFSIYEKAEDDLKKQARNINLFITQMQQRYGIDDAHTYLMGFSQGAMLTIYTALTRRSCLAGGFVLSGLVAAKNNLQKQICSRPFLYLFHGAEDLKVQYKTLPDSISWLQANNVPCQSKVYLQLAHNINEDEINIVAQIVNHRQV